MLHAVIGGTLRKFSSLNRSRKLFTVRRACQRAAAFQLESLEERRLLSGVLGTAESFGVLAASAVSNTGSTVIAGNVGTSPGTASSITGFPPGSITAPATLHAADGVALQAQADATAAYLNFFALPGAVNMSGTDLGGLTLTPGVYKFDSSAQLTGTLTLDFQGLSGQSFVFQFGSALTTASASSVLGINMGQDDNIYWEVGSSATLGTTTDFAGNIIANTSITLDTN